jgi:diguanylate cyclase (GGDEF)-like protein/PAS domain S-box-containing protein
MSHQIKPHKFSRYLMLGLFSIILTLLVSLLAYFLVSQKQAAEADLHSLHTQIYAEQRTRMAAEAEKAAEHVLFTYHQAEDILKAQSESQVEQAMTIAGALYERYQAELPEAELKSLIVETLRDIRFFNGRGYLFIDDMAGNCILLPTAPQLEGRSLYDNRDDTGHYIMRGLIDAVQNPQGRGFSRYRWYPPGTKQQMVDKLAYVQKFEPYDWIIGTGDYLYRIEQDLQQPELERLAQLRFGTSGYIAVVRRDGLLLKSAAAPHLEGKHLSEMPETEQRSLREIIRSADAGGGFLRYQWHHLDDRRPQEKLSYVKPLPVWDWIIVAGAYPGDIEALISERNTVLDQNFRDNMQRLLLTFAAVGLIALLLSTFYSRWLGRRFRRYQREIDLRQRTLEDNAKSMEISDRIVSSASEGILVTDANNRIIRINEAFSRITGYDPEDVLGQKPEMLSSGRHDAAFYSRMWSELLTQGRWQGEIWNKRKDGQSYPEWLSLTLFRDASGQILNHIATFTDISQRKAYEARLSYLADYDTLTDLPNRRMLSDRLSQQLAHARRAPDEQVALFFVDLDHFKNINDSLGHAAGDAVLVEVSRRLKACVRECDTVSRIGGDEFVLLVSVQGDVSHLATRLASRILEQVALPIHHDREELVVTPSIGIAVAPQDGDCAEALLRHADTALYHAKHEGRRNFQFFTNQMNERVTARLEMEHRIRGAMARDEFRLYYQPQVSLKSKQIESVEALLRWPQADGSFTPPDQFIPIAEESGQILELGDWILHQACQDAADWHRKGHPVSVAVNISSRQLRHSRLLETISDALSRSGLPPQALIVEMTETALMGDMDSAADILRNIQSLGVKLSLDDFGTGYSSLSFLKRFPVDELKIDRSFIDGVPTDKDDAAITSSLVYVAHNLALSVVAEGVETVTQQQYLERIGCDKAQGYLYSPAVPPETLVPLLAQAITPS